ncbi:unnamed protein product [Brachionus calyciflorus]|uniref:Uncharacterized protein n=1 Tax=Brachionus calyciflorus TaxID=104777 RepID=A0A813XY67_9BILA|nr:unnamed protein product [Brachionus calyciflorus]
MSKKIRSVIEESLFSSTSHGIPNIIRSDNLILRVMWILFTVISTGLCGYMIVQSIMNYFSYETTSKIQINTETSSIFPAITICNLNFFTSKYSAKFIKNLTLEAELDSFYFNYNQYYTFMQIVSTSEELISNSHKFGDSFEKLILHFQLLTIDCKNKEYWNYYYHQLYGNCYQINTKNDNLIRVRRTGWYNALNIILNISLADGLEGLYAGIGAVVMLHNQTTSPLSTDAFSVSPGVDTNIAASRQFKSSLPKPYSDCDGDTSNGNVFNSKLFKLITSKNISYNQKLCMDGDFPFISDEFVKPCYSDTEYECINSKIENDFTNSSITNDICQSQCPLECNSMNYKIFYSFNDFINEKNNEDLNNFYNFTGTNRRQMKNDLVSLYFYYETLSYERITEKESIDLVGLLSNLGGIAGLFLAKGYSYSDKVGNECEFYILDDDHIDKPDLKKIKKLERRRLIKKRAEKSDDKPRKILCVVEKPYHPSVVTALPLFEADRQFIKRVQKQNKTEYPKDPELLSDIEIPDWLREIIQKKIFIL